MWPFSLLFHKLWTTKMKCQDRRCAAIFESAKDARGKEEVWHPPTFSSLLPSTHRDLEGRQRAGENWVRALLSKEEDVSRSWPTADVTGYFWYLCQGHRHQLARPLKWILTEMVCSLTINIFIIYVCEKKENFICPHTHTRLSNMSLSDYIRMTPVLSSGTEVFLFLFFNSCPLAWKIVANKLYLYLAWLGICEGNRKECLTCTFTTTHFHRQQSFATEVKIIHIFL